MLLACRHTGSKTSLCLFIRSAEGTGENPGLGWSCDLLDDQITCRDCMNTLLSLYAYFSIVKKKKKSYTEVVFVLLEEISVLIVSRQALLNFVGVVCGHGCKPGVMEN